MWHWLLVAITKHRVLIRVTCVSFSSWCSSYVTCTQHVCRSSWCQNVTPVAAIATCIRRGPQNRPLCTDVSRWFGRSMVTSFGLGWATRESGSDFLQNGSKLWSIPSSDSCRIDTECICTSLFLYCTLTEVFPCFFLSFKSNARV
jgi:hypothetical protein